MNTKTNCAMNASHTPGKWTIDQTTGVNMAPVYLIESAEGQSIATVKKQADAMLIRSAPTLLAQRDEPIDYKRDCIKAFQMAQIVLKQTQDSLL